MKEHKDFVMIPLPPNHTRISISKNNDVFNDAVGRKSDLCEILEKSAINFANGYTYVLAISPRIHNVNYGIALYPGLDTRYAKKVIQIAFALSNKTGKCVKLDTILSSKTSTKLMHHHEYTGCYITTSNYILKQGHTNMTIFMCHKLTQEYPVLVSYSTDDYIMARTLAIILAPLATRTQVNNLLQRLAEFLNEAKRKGYFQCPQNLHEAFRSAKGFTTNTYEWSQVSDYEKFVSQCNVECILVSIAKMSMDITVASSQVLIEAFDDIIGSNIDPVRLAFTTM
jgi:hypothetical protein